MPKIACYTLVWSPLHHAYELHESKGDGVLDIVPESPTVLVWVRQISSFAFHGRNGSYTARKEHKQRGEGYWYAYARVGGKRTKRYLGRGIDLTLPRLEQAAQELWRDPQASLGQKEERGSSRPLPSSHATLGEKVFLPDHLSEGHTLSSDDTEHSRNSDVGGRKTKLSPAISRLPSGPLLATKLHVPRPHSHLVHRPHLIQRLQQGMEQAMILISAPAGFGKSTLLLDWITSREQQVAWVSLDTGDNDPVRFWRYVVAGLQSALAKTEMGTSALAALGEFGPAHLEPVLVDLLNELATIEQDLALVLDDYQAITTPTIHDTLTFLLEHLPPRLHLVLATRTDPPLPLARLRAGGQLLELRAEDLRFSAEEATRFLGDTMGLVLHADQLAELAARSEGWVAGLQLAALALQGRTDVDQFLAHFSGTHRYLMDYLTEEVLRCVPEPEQRFLLETSLLDRLCAPLCAAVTGSSEAQALLEQVERANLFLGPLDDHHEWYRYHALFAEFLQERLRQTFPEEVEPLHRRAAKWFEEHGLIPEAVRHTLAGADYEHAVRLVTQSARKFLLRGETATLRSWLQALPEDLVRARPRLCMILGHELSFSGEFEAADAWLRAAEARLRAAESEGADEADTEVREEEGGLRATLQEVLALRARIAALGGDLPLALELVHQVGDPLPSDNPLLRSLVAFDLNAAYFWSGDMLAAGLAHRELRLAGAAAGSLYFELLGLSGEGWVQMVRGELRQAVETFRHVLQRVAGQQGPLALVAGGAHTGLGMVLREWNHLESAEQQLRTGIELTTRGDISVLVLLGSFHLARVRQARGDAAGALELLVHADEAMRRSGGEVLVGVVAVCQAQLLLQKGNLAAARHWATTASLDPDQPITLLGELERLALVRVQIAQGRAEVALHELERLYAAAEAVGRGGSVLEVLVLRALALQVQGNRTAALAALGRALALAEPEGYLRLFLDEGPPMRALLQEAQRQGLFPEYLAKLLEAESESGGTATPPHTATASSLVEPLTVREREVLQLVLDGASNREIACRLIVSVNTVKKHVVNIYGKLNVRSRVQAIMKAQALHLL